MNVKEAISSNDQQDKLLETKFHKPKSRSKKDKSYQAKHGKRSQSTEPNDLRINNVYSDNKMASRKKAIKYGLSTQNRNLSKASLLKHKESVALNCLKEISMHQDDIFSEFNREVDVVFRTRIFDIEDEPQNEEPLKKDFQSTANFDRKNSYDSSNDNQKERYNLVSGPQLMTKTEADDSDLNIGQYGNTVSALSGRVALPSCSNCYREPNNTNEDNTVLYTKLNKNSLSFMKEANNSWLEQQLNTYTDFSFIHHNEQSNLDTSGPRDTSKDPSYQKNKSKILYSKNSPRKEPIILTNYPLEKSESTRLSHNKSKQVYLPQINDIKHKDHYVHLKHNRVAGRLFKGRYIAPISPTYKESVVSMDTEDLDIVNYVSNGNKESKSTSIVDNKGASTERDVINRINNDIVDSKTLVEIDDFKKRTFSINNLYKRLHSNLKKPGSIGTHNLIRKSNAPPQPVKLSQAIKLLNLQELGSIVHKLPSQDAASDKDLPALQEHRNTKIFYKFEDEAQSSQIGITNRQLKDKSTSISPIINKRPTRDNAYPKSIDLGQTKSVPTDVSFFKFLNLSDFSIPCMSLYRSLDLETLHP